MNSLILAQVSGEAVVHSLVYFIILGVIFGLLWWLLDYVKVPEPFNKIGRVILAVAAVVVLIGWLLGLAGHPLVRW